MKSISRYGKKAREEDAMRWKFKKTNELERLINKENDTSVREKLLKELYNLQF